MYYNKERVFLFKYFINKNFKDLKMNLKINLYVYLYF